MCEIRRNLPNTVYQRVDRLLHLSVGELLRVAYELGDERMEIDEPLGVARRVKSCEAFRNFVGAGNA